MATLFQHPNLKAYKQHGFIPQGESGGTQAIGRCPFCGANKKFFVNPESKAWDCKVCGKNGGYQKFLQQMAKHCQKNFKGSIAQKLIKSRGLKESTLRHHGVGYNPLIGGYTLPVWDKDKESLLNLRIYKNGILANTQGCKGALYGLPDITQAHRTIWLVEGEWDRMAMWEMLKETGLQKDTIVLSVPGASSFKSEWQFYFQGKIVHVAFDNDYDKEIKGVFRAGAGKLGSRKVKENIHGVAKILDFVNWPNHWDDGFDVRDFYVKKRKCKAEKALRGLVKMLKSTPMPILYPEGQAPEMEENDGSAPALALDGKGVKPDEVYKQWQEWLEIPNTDCIDVLYGMIAANRFSNDPIWLFFVGDSGGMKSDLVMAVDGWDEIMSISSLTPNTLISGSATGSKDPSLVPQLDGKVLAIKDFTTVLNMQQQSRDAIMGQLRDAFDGKCAKPFGTGVMRVYESKFGLVSGVTPAVEQFLEGGTAMGERFLTYPLPGHPTFASVNSILDRVFENTLELRKSEMRDALQSLSREVLNFDFGNRIAVNMEYRERIKALCFWVSRMRGTVTRDKFRKEITHRPYIELPTRLVSQFVSLSAGITLFRRKTELTESEYRIMKDIAHGSAPYHEETIIRSMWQENPKGKYKTEDIVDWLRLPWDTVHRFAENLVQLGMLRKKTTQGHRIDASYYLSKDALQCIKIAEIYKPSK